MFFDCYLFLVFPFNLFSHNSYNPKVRYLCLNQMYASVCVCVCVCVCYVYLHVCVCLRPSTVKALSWVSDWVLSTHLRSIYIF